MTHSKIGSRWCSAYSYTSYANPNTNCGSTSNSCNTSKFDSDRFRVTDNNWTSSPFKLFAFSDEFNWSFDRSDFPSPILDSNHISASSLQTAPAVSVPPISSVPSLTPISQGKHKDYNRFLMFV